MNKLFYYLGAMMIFNASVSLGKPLVDPTLPANYEGEVTTSYDSNIRMIKQNPDGKSEVLIGSQNFTVGDKLSCNSQLTKIDLEQITVNDQKNGRTRVIALSPFTIKTVSNNVSEEKQNVN